MNSIIRNREKGELNRSKNDSFPLNKFKILYMENKDKGIRKIAESLCKIQCVLAEVDILIPN